MAPGNQHAPRLPCTVLGPSSPVQKLEKSKEEEKGNSLMLWEKGAKPPTGGLTCRDTLFKWTHHLLESTEEYRSEGLKYTIYTINFEWTQE
jgi:hypothetical protein